MTPSDTTERGVKNPPFYGGTNFHSFAQNKWLKRAKSGKMERRIIRTWVSDLSSSLEIFAPVIASGMCDLPMLNKKKKKKKEAMFTGVITGIYGPIYYIYIIYPTQWEKGHQLLKNWCLLFTAWAFKDNFQVIDNKAVVFFESAYKCLFMDAVHTPWLCRENSLYIWK